MVENSKFQGLVEILLCVLANLKNRPLPPLDWRRIVNVHLKQHKNKVLEIISKQCSSSTSAKALLEDFLASYSSCEVALDLMPHFKHFYHGVSAALVQPHLSESLVLWFQSSTKDKNCLKSFESLLKSYIQVMKSEDYEQKNDIVDAIMDLDKEIHALDIEPDIMDKYCECVLDLPFEACEVVADPLRFGSIRRVKTALKIRQDLALKRKEYSLSAMNVIVDHLAKDEEFEDYFQDVKDTLVIVLKLVKEEKQMRQWLLELMGQILFLIRQNCSVWTFNFMFEIFALTIAILAFKEPRSSNMDFQGLPFALATMLKQEKFQDLGPQLAEWMIELSSKEILSPVHQKVILQSCLGVKFCDGYNESNIWGRLTMLEMNL